MSMGMNAMITMAAGLIGVEKQPVYQMTPTEFLAHLRLYVENREAKRRVGTKEVLTRGASKRLFKQAGRKLYDDGDVDGFADIMAEALT